MTYLLLSLAVALPVVAVAVVLLARQGRSALAAAGVALVALVVLTVVFDSVIVGTGIVAYDRSRILGLRIGAAPVEDFAYPIVAATALPAIWLLLGRRRGRA